MKVKTTEIVPYFFGKSMYEYTLTTENKNIRNTINITSQILIFLFSNSF